MAAASVIERASPEARHAKAFSSADIFLLDGEELVPCATGSVSPSCTMGGTHSTRIESYSRIVHSGTTWTITSPAACTQRVYQPIWWGLNGLAFRWGLVSTTDTVGNTVSYGWANELTSTNQTLDTYISAISYNGNTINFYREVRPDPITFASGQGYLARTDFRVQTIDIWTSGIRVRAYKLTYQQDPFTGRSSLLRVQQFGRDTTFSGLTVTGGSSLSPWTMAVASTPACPAVTTACFPVGFVGPLPYGAVTCQGGSALPAVCYGTPQSFTPWPGYAIASARMRPGDFNGDGRMDLIDVVDGSDTRRTRGSPTATERSAS